jgi:hypothetical protein
VANYTRGPLKLGAWTNHGLMIVSERDVHLGYAQGFPNPEPHQVSEAVAAANGTLWAAAPDLLECLDTLLDLAPFASNDNERELHLRCESVIRKAKGLPAVKP